jgi:hypothetical protein
MLRASRYIASLFAVCLAIGETMLNWGHWQFWPLWVVDYVIAVWLLIAVWLTRRPGASHHLTTAWAFTAGVLYMALFGGMDELRRSSHQGSEDVVFMWLVAGMLGVSLLGLGFSMGASSRSNSHDEIAGT